MHVLQNAPDPSLTEAIQGLARESKEGYDGLRLEVTGLGQQMSAMNETLTQMYTFMQAYAPPLSRTRYPRPACPSHLSRG